MTTSLKDKFGRIHDYLRISLTDKCNLRCTYCMPANPYYLPKEHLLTFEEIYKIAEIFVNDFGIKKIRFTGGEPLVRKEAGKIIEQISRLPVELAITTNGILLDEYLPLFERIGLASVNISLDSLNPKRFEKITKRPIFEKVMSNIEKALQSGLHIKINTVLMYGQNEDEIIDFVNWTRDVPIHVRFIEFMPFYGNNWDREKTLSFQEIMDRIANIYPVVRLKDAPNSTSKSYRVKGFKGTFAVISSVTAPFCEGCNRIRLTVDGKLKNCLFSNDEADLLSVLRAGEDVKPVIVNCIYSKYAEKGGLMGFDKVDARYDYDRGRSMTAIGG